MLKSVARSKRKQGRFWGVENQLAALLVLAILFGGGGSAYGVYNLIVQFAALVILAANPRLFVAFVLGRPLAMVLLIGLTVALPLVQLVPLPPYMWSVLPGRDLLLQSFDLIGVSDRWFPISLTPSRTLTAFLSLIPVLAILVLASALNRKGWIFVLQMIVWSGVTLTMLGGLQLLTRNEHFLLFRERVNPSWMYATFANHNTTGLFFLLAILAVVALHFTFGRARNSMWRAGFFFAAFAIAAILSQSRSSMGLLLAIFAVGAAITFQRSKMARLHKFAVALVMLMSFVGVLLALTVETRFGQSFGRFEDLDNVRPAIWSDTLSSIERFWPIGSGISSFPEVFEVDETLENVWAYHAGRAHNDYLEIVQEAGIAGLGLIVAWGLWCASTWKRAWGGEYKGQATVGLCGLLVIALQSIVDYPLRNQSILCVAAIFLSLLMNSVERKSDVQS